LLWQRQRSFNKAGAARPQQGQALDRQTLARLPPTVAGVRAMMSNLVILNFRISVLASIIGSIFLFSAIASGHSEPLKSITLFSSRALIWPALFPALTLLFWFAYYRHNEGELAAFLLGFVALIPVVSSFISASINDVQFNGSQQLFLGYVGASHVLYAFRSPKEIVEALGKDVQP
jgi:hypothetical protein